MRANIKFGLAMRFFLGPLLSYFALFTFVAVCTFSLFLVIDSYEYQVEARFASKQPHFTLILDDSLENWQTYKHSKEMARLKQGLKNQENILAVSEFIKVTKWLRLKAATSQLSGFEAKQEFDKFSTGEVSLIAIEKSLPGVIPLTELNYYDAGPYKFKITNLEYAADWLTNPNLILPNAVLDASFYAPISQQVSVNYNDFSHPAQIKAFVNDYADESILYLGLKQIEHWLDAKDVLEEGLYIRIQDTRQLALIKNTILAELEMTGKKWLVSTWLDEKSKQKSILLMTKLLGYSLIVILIVMLMLVMALNQSNVFIKKAKSLNILFMTGYVLTGPLLLSSLGVSFLGVGLAYLAVTAWVKPQILMAFNINVSIQEGTAWGVCLITLFLINGLNLLAIKNRLGK